MARVAVPLVVALVALGVVISFAMNTRQTPPAPVSATPDANSGAEQPGADESSEPDANVAASPEPSQSLDEPLVETPEPPPSDDMADAPVVEPTTASDAAEPADQERIGLRARIVSQTPGAYQSIGSLDPDGDYTMRVDFAPTGAGVESITLARYYTDVQQSEHFAVQSRRTFQTTSSRIVVTSLAARAVIIDGQQIDLYSVVNGSIWRETGPGAFEAIIEGEDGIAVARIEKRYLLQPDSYNILIDQRLENLSDAPMSVEWVQYGPVDLPDDDMGYGGDKRRVRFGYLLDTQRDPTQQYVQTERKLHSRTSVIDNPEDEFGRIWPTSDAMKEGWTLVWAAMTNRYFAFVVHPTIDPDAAAGGQPVDKALKLASSRVDRVVVGGRAGAADDRVVVMQLWSEPETLSPGASLDLSMSAYTGPKWRKTVGENPVYTTLGMDKLIVFNFGGPCAFCTFQWLARGLLHFLGFFHDVLFHDWAIAIMFLVVCVRAALHPITKRSQISVQRFSRQMQALAPKQKKLQEKYKDDRKRLQEEMAKLMREEGVNFSGALGCLPMFLQSPIWIALYAMLYFAFDLRHQPAFYGVFQSITAGNWSFLRDLSAPDAFVSFGQPIFSLPLFGAVTSFNVLPILLGVVFYGHQKYMTPPPSASLTPEQEMQQKIMKVMMVVMFPVLMYNAPSGLSLYFITNSLLGIVESRYIRSHIDQLDLESKNKPSEGKPRKVANTAKQPPSSPFKKKRERTPNYKKRRK